MNSLVKDVDWCLNTGWCESCTYADEKSMMTCRKLMKDVKEELERMSVFGKWVPCSERLPDEHKMVLVTVGWEDEVFKNYGVYDAVYGSDGLWHGQGYEPMRCKVVAWMPLPEAYDGE